MKITNPPSLTLEDELSLVMEWAHNSKVSSLAKKILIELAKSIGSDIRVRLLPRLLQDQLKLSNSELQNGINELADTGTIVFHPERQRLEQQIILLRIDKRHWRH